MALDSATLFAQNREEVMTPILPADQIGANAIRGLTVVPEKNDYTKTESLSSRPDARTLADSANIAGDSLRSIEGAHAPQGDAAYMGGQAAKLAMEAGGVTLKLGGEAIVGLLGAITGKQQTPDDMEEVRFRPAPTFSQGMPSPGGGMGA